MMRNKTRNVLSLFAVVLASMVLIVPFMYFHDFAVVVPGKVYRSRELTQSQFEQVIRRYQLKSIINLRGAHPGLPWYQHEMAAVHATDIKHYDIALSSKKLPPLPKLKRLVKILDEAPRPTLIHCLSGVDRTGLAAVLILILHNEHDINIIRQQVSLDHFVLSNQSVGRQVLRLYLKWLKEQRLTTSKANFYAWLKQLKPGASYPAKTS